MGLCMGLGTAAGMVIKLWMSFEGGPAPFWLWTIPVVIVLVGLSVWWSQRRRDAEIRRRLERSARVPRARVEAERGEGPVVEEVEGRTGV